MPHTKIHLGSAPGRKVFKFRSDSMLRFRANPLCSTKCVLSGADRG